MTCQRGANAEIRLHLIGVTGASAPGKRTICQKIISGLHYKRCRVVNLEWFPYGLSSVTDAASHNFDHPNSLDFKTLREILVEMKQCRLLEVPRYDSALFKRVETSAIELGAADVIIVVGIFTLHDENIRDMLDIKIYVEEDARICLSRPVKRDIASRGRTKESLFTEFEKFIKPCLEDDMFRTEKFADITLPGGGENHAAISMMVTHIQLQISEQETRETSENPAQMKQRRKSMLRTDVLEKAPKNVPQKALQRNLNEVTNLVLISEHIQNQAWETMFRSAVMNRDNMMLCYNLLVRTLIEQALGILPFERKIVKAMTGAHFFKVSCSGNLVAFGLLPHGKKMEDTLKGVCDGVSIGKVHIDSQGTDVKVSDVPDDMRKRYVMVLAPMLDNGKLCVKAIEKLKEGFSGCQEDKIMVLSLVVTPEAIGTICSQYQKIRLVASLVDKGQHSGENVKSSVVTFLRSFWKIRS